MQKPRAAFTFFHTLWLTGTLAAPAATYVELRHAALAMRLGFTLLALPLGFLVSGLAVLLLVTSIVIPRVERGSYWSYEVNCYMLFMFGDEWGKL